MTVPPPAITPTVHGCYADSDQLLSARTPQEQALEHPGTPRWKQGRHRHMRLRATGGSDFDTIYLPSKTPTDLVLPAQSAQASRAIVNAAADLQLAGKLPGRFWNTSCCRSRRQSPSLTPFLRRRNVNAWPFLEHRRGRVLTCSTAYWLKRRTENNQDSLCLVVTVVY